MLKNSFPTHPIYWEIQALLTPAVSHLTTIFTILYNSNNIILIIVATFGVFYLITLIRNRNNIFGLEKNKNSKNRKFQEKSSIITRNKKTRNFGRGKFGGGGASGKWWSFPKVNI